MLKSTARLLREAATSGRAPEAGFEPQRGKIIELFNQLGSTQNRSSSFRPHKAVSAPPSPSQVTVSHLLAAQAQMGHNMTSFSPTNTPFVYGTRHGQAIIDLERATLPALRRAAEVVKGVVKADGVVVFVGTREGHKPVVLRAAQRLGRNGFHVTTHKWMPGVLTNAAKLLAPTLTTTFAAAAAAAEASGRQDSASAEAREQARLAGEDPLKATYKLLPDLLVILNPLENVHAIREANLVGVPTIGIIDTDVDPRLVTYAIPANDDSVRTVELVAGVLSKAGEEGMKERKRVWDAWDKGSRMEKRDRRARIHTSS